MTFPNIHVYGGRTSIQKQLGNAVPSLMTEILSREMLRQFFGVDKFGPLSLMPIKKDIVSEPETVLPVSSQYLHLVGDHSPHPGTGKGRIAQLRKSNAA
jgi:DNA (cytosine-5)-methyltransferase 1